MSNETSARSAEELLPCPFCSAPAQQFMWDLHYGCSDSQCGAYMANLTAEQWNRRPAPETGVVLSSQERHAVHNALSFFEEYRKGYTPFIDPTMVALLKRLDGSSSVKAGGVLGSEK